MFENSGDRMTNLITDDLPTENFAEQFAKYKGAKLSPIDTTENLSLELPGIDLPDEGEDGRDLGEPEEDGFIQTHFSQGKPIWKNPKLKILAIGLPTLVTVFAVVGLLMGDFKFQSPQQSVQSPPPPDDTKPTSANPGQLQAQALSRQLSGLDQQNPRPVDSSAVSSPQPNPASSQVTVSPQTAASPVAAQVRPRPEATTGYTSAYTRPWERRASFRRPSDYGFASPNQPSSRVNRSSRSAISPQSRAEQQEAAQKRWLALAMGTSSSGGSQGSDTVGDPNQTVPVNGSIPRPNGVSRPAILGSEQAILDGQPQTLIPRSTKATGRLLTGLAFTPDGLAALAGQPIEIQIDDPQQTKIPSGARLLATVDAPNGGSVGGGYGSRSGSVVRLVPVALVIGDIEIPIEANAILISGKDGQPLIAKSKNMGFFRSLLSTAAQGLGQGLGTGFGGFGRNYLTSIGGNIGSTMVGNTMQRLGQNNQQSIMILPEQSHLQISVIRPISLSQALLGGNSGQ
jgi:hypothetical protein